MRALLLLILTGIFLALPAQAQVGGGVTSSGAITAGHCVQWLSANVIQDSGSACGGGGGGSTSLSALTSATATNSIDSTLFAQTWLFSTATSQNPLSITATSLTSGSVLTLTTTAGAKALTVVGNTSLGGTTTTTNLIVTSGTTLSALTTGYLNVGGTGVVASTLPVTTTGDLSVTTSGVATVAGIQGNAVSGVTGSGGLVVESTLPTFQTGINVGNALTLSATVPSIASGFGTGASVTTGTDSAFLLNVGTGGSATTGVIAMNATASNGWNCSVNIQSLADQATMHTNAISSTATAATLQNYLYATTTIGAWTASDVLAVNCVAR